MQCLYCDQRLNIFKSVGGWSFCSPEHQQLYQEKESHVAFERLLEFATKDSEPAAAPEQTEPEVQAPPEPATEPPVVGFLVEPIGVQPLTASPVATAGFEIPESGFTPDPPALPSLNIGIAVTEGPADQPPPYPCTSWSHFSPAEMDAPAAFAQLPSVGPLRPRATLDLARLDHDHGKAQTANESARWLSLKPRMVVGLNLVPQAKPCGDASDAYFAMGMAGAVSRDLIGSNVSPAVPLPQPVGALGVSDDPCPIFSGVQDASALGKLAIVPARTEQRECQAPSMHWRARQASVALTCAGLAAAVCRPHTPLSRNGSTLESSGSAWLAQREWVMPADSIALELAAVKGPVVIPRNLTIRERDMADAVGITDAAKPAAPATPIRILDASATRCSVTMVINRMAWKIPAQVQDHGGFQSGLVSPALPARRECLLPAIFWSSQTWLRSAIAFLGRTDESDYAFQAFPAEAPVIGPFSIRFAQERSRLDAPAIAFQRTTRRLTLEVCEWKAGAAELARVRPSATSPLSLVALPEVSVKRLAVRFIENLNQFSSITNSADRGVVPSATASTDQHKPVMALPRSPGVGLSRGFHLSSQAAVKSPLIEPTGIKFADAALLPPPSPVRVQPAALLVLPCSIPIGSQVVGKGSERSRGPVVRQET